MTKTIARVKVIQDNANSPRDDFDHLGVMALAQPRDGAYADGKSVDQGTYLAENGEERDDVIVTLKDGSSVSWADLERGIGANNEPVISMRVYRYSHSGDFFFTMHNPAAHTVPDWQWDVSFVGYVFAYVSNVMTEFEWESPLTDEQVEQIKSCLDGEVREYNAWANGDVYGIVSEVIHIPDSVAEWLSNDDEELLTYADELNGKWEHVDSCWGFYDDENDYVLNEAKEWAQRLADENNVTVPIIWLGDLREEVAPADKENQDEPTD